MKSEEIMKLVKELKTEVWHVGFNKALYDHGQAHQHTEERRSEIKNRHKIVNSILRDIEAQLNTPEPPKEPTPNTEGEADGM